MPTEQERAESIVQRYEDALLVVQNAPTTPMRYAAGRIMETVLDAAADLENQAEDERVKYAMSKLRQYRDETGPNRTYGVEVPDTDTLMWRSVVGYRRYA